MSGTPGLDRILEHFVAFRRVAVDLPLYARFTDGCLDDPEVAGLLLAARPGQARPVLLYAAVHDLVLRDPDLPLAAWYSSVRDDPVPVAAADPWPTFRQTSLDRAEALRSVIATHATQTNEVNRAAVLVPLVAAACADLPDRPVTIVELGASAGLLAGLERYAVDVGGVIVGDPTSPVHLATRLHGGAVPDLSTFPPTIVERIGIDRDPVVLDDEDRVRWLAACLWPDEPWRVERFRAACSVTAADPPAAITGDFVDELEVVAAATDPDTHLVVFDTWALTYVARERRPEVPAALGRIAASGRAVSWLTVEPPRAVPDLEPAPWLGGTADVAPETVLGMQRWRSGNTTGPEAMGWCHPHGNWLTWTAR